jgi:hypothetical protein
MSLVVEFFRGDEGLGEEMMRLHDYFFIALTNNTVKPYKIHQTHHSKSFFLIPPTFPLTYL